MYNDNDYDYDNIINLHNLNYDKSSREFNDSSQISSLNNEKISTIEKNFINITDKEKQKELINNGILKPMYLVSLDFGGSPNEDNIIYVTQSALDKKIIIDEELKDFIIKGNKVKFNCNLEYIEKSIVPAKIIITYNLNGERDYRKEITVWNNKKVNNSDVEKNTQNKMNINVNKNSKNINKDKTANPIILSLFGLMCGFTGIMILVYSFSNKEIKYMFMSLFMIMCSFLSFYPLFYKSLNKRKKFLKREELIRKIDKIRVYFEKEVATVHIGCFLLNIREELESHKYKNDNRFVTYGRLDSLEKEIKEELNNNNLLGAMVNFYNYVRFSGNFSSQQIPQNINSQKLLKDYEKYYRSGIICKEEKEKLLQLINLIEQYINKGDE